MCSLHANRFELIFIIRKCVSELVLLPLALLQLTEWMRTTYFVAYPRYSTVPNIEYVIKMLDKHINKLHLILLCNSFSQVRHCHISTDFPSEQTIDTTSAQCSWCWSIVYSIKWFLFPIQQEQQIPKNHSVISITFHCFPEQKVCRKTENSKI